MSIIYVLLFFHPTKVHEKLTTIPDTVY